MIKLNQLINDLERQVNLGNNRSGFIRLDKNERTIPFSERDIEMMFSKIKGQHLNMYPDQTKMYNLFKKFALYCSSNFENPQKRKRKPCFDCSLNMSF